MLATENIEQFFENFWATKLFASVSPTIIAVMKRFQWRRTNLFSIMPDRS